MDNFHTQLLTIEGMQDHDSVEGVTHALGVVPGVRLESVELGQATVMAEPELEPSIREALALAGFSLVYAQVQSGTETRT